MLIVALKSKKGGQSMKITSIQLKNYRNYDFCDIELTDQLNLIIGDNGQGKTNLLETLYVAGFGKSFRTSKDSELIQMNEKMMHLKVNFEKFGRQQSVEIKLISDKKKEIRINGSVITKVSDLIGHLNLVLFSPEDLKLVKESPGERRKFLDRELSHISPMYCRQIIEYNKILDQRNSFLKQLQTTGSKQYDILDIWDEKLVKSGVPIIMKRFSFVEKLAEISEDIHKSITAGKERLKVNYICSVKSPNPLEYDKIQSEFLCAIEKSRERDIYRGYTSTGPHRDDIGLFINGTDIRTYGSQGQQRTAALSLKLSEIDIIKDEIGEYPILLLDDVMSELDVTRQNFLIKTFDRLQTIVTSTEVGRLYDEHLQKGKIFRVAEGKIL